MTEVTNSFLSQPTGGNSGDQKQTNNTKNPERLGTNTRQKLSEDDDDDGNDIDDDKKKTRTHYYYDY